MNKLFPKVEPASYSMLVHICGVIGSSPCSVTLYVPDSNSTSVPVLMSQESYFVMDCYLLLQQ